MTPETPDFTKVERFAVVTVYAREGALGAGATRQATNGDWVRFSDYESLLAAHEQVTQENARLKERSKENAKGWVREERKAQEFFNDLAALRAAVRERADEWEATASITAKHGDRTATAAFETCADQLRALLQPDTETL